jgi:ribonuclease J
MKLIVHRGTRQIGGSCVELAVEGGRLLLDLGSPLPTPGDAPPPEDPREAGQLPRIPGIYADDEPSVTALVLSHAHADHYGLADYVHPEIPVFASDGTAVLLAASRIFFSRSPFRRDLSLLPKGEPLSIGPFTVTGHLVDHSAPDALALLVEGEGHRVFYSGDLRGHGRKAALFERLVKRPPENVDCLLLEGTMLGRGAQAIPDERSVEAALADVFRRKMGPALVFCSSQNLDRLVSIYRAVKRSGCFLVIDLYTAYVLQALRVLSDSIPQFDWPLVRVKYWNHHADCLAKAGKRNFLYQVREAKIEVEEIGQRGREVVMLAKSNQLLSALAKHLPRTDTLELIWSMWPGYLTGDNVVTRFCDEHKLQLRRVHTSGHAPTEDLQRLARALQPKQLIPIHTFERERYAELFDNVHMTEDGQEIHL